MKIETNQSCFKAINLHAFESFLKKKAWK